MNGKFKAAGIVAAGLIIAAAAVSPATAAGGRWGGNGNGPGTGVSASSGSNCTGTQQGARMGGYGHGAGARGGMQGQQHVLAPMGTLTEDQKANLLSMVEEEKLAHDVYVAIAAKYPTLYQFANISTAELQHQTALRNLLTRYGIADPTAGLASGQFATASFQNLYNKYIAEAASTSAALAVGVAIEKLDIADLSSNLNGLTAPDVVQVFTNLRNASQHHLAAFGG